MKWDSLRVLFLDNAMLTEGSRSLRKFGRNARTTKSRAVNAVVFILIAFFYLWLCVVATNYPEAWRAILPNIELLLITLAVPASIYGAVANERERATWEALILTRLTPGQIIYGKLIWRILQVVLIAGLMTILMGVNLISLPDNLRYGSWEGASSSGDGGMPHPWLNLFQLQFMMLAWGLLLAGFGLWVSSGSRRSVTAAAVTFGSLLGGLVLLPTLFSLIGAGLQSSRILSGDTWSTVQLLWLQYNPFYLVSVVSSNGKSSGVMLTDQWLFAYPGATLLYTIMAAWLIYGAHVRLRILEEPKRK